MLFGFPQHQLDKSPLCKGLRPMPPNECQFRVAPPHAGTVAFLRGRQGEAGRGLNLPAPQAGLGSPFSPLSLLHPVPLGAFRCEPGIIFFCH